MEVDPEVISLTDYESLFEEGVGDFDLDRDGRALFSARPDNVVVLKVNYRIAR